MKFIFVSPHFDDICFSLDGFINKIKNFDKEIINVFTRSSYIRRMKLICSDQNFKEDIVSKIRDNEDNNYLNQYNFLNKRNLDFKDCGNFDKDKKEKLKSILMESITNTEEPILVFPMGVGLHHDHVKVFETCCELIEENKYKFDYIIYEDLPYSHVKKDRKNRVKQLDEFIKKHNLFYHKNYLNRTDIKNKCNSIMFYETQHVYKNPFFVRIRRYYQQNFIFSKKYEGMWTNNKNLMINFL